MPDREMEKGVMTMADKGKVIKGIDICLQRFHCGEDCPYYENRGTGCMEQLREDALAMLKEQEPIAPSVCGSKEPDGHGSWWYMCGKCKMPIDPKERFCRRCGQAAKWE